MKTILVVEDNPVEAKILKMGLEKANFKVHLASNGYYALDLLKDHRVDLIMTDLMMGQMNGFRLIKILKTTQDYRAIPVIVCSSVSDKGDVQKAIRLGANGYVLKPFDLNTVFLKISSILSTQTNPVIHEAPEYRDPIGLGELDFKSRITAFSEQGLKIISPSPLPLEAQFKITSSVFNRIDSTNELIFQVESCARFHEQYEVLLFCINIPSESLKNAWIPPINLTDWNEQIENRLNEAIISVKTGIISIEASSLKIVSEVPFRKGQGFTIKCGLFNDIGISSNNFEVTEQLNNPFMNCLQASFKELEISDQQKLLSWSKKTSTLKRAG